MMKKGNASISFIFLTILIDVIGIGIIIPVLPSLIESLNGDGLSEASRIGGWLIFSYALMQFFFAPVLGVISDRVGRKPVLLVALFGLGLDYLLHAFAPTLFWLFVGRVIAGLCGASVTVATAYIADISTPEKKAQNFGVIGAAFGLGFIVGPVIGGIAGEYSVQLPFLIAATLSFVNFLYGFFLIPESLDKSKRRTINWKKANPIGSFHLLTQSKVVIGLSLAFFLLYIAGYAVQSTWAFYGMFKFDWTESMVGYSLALVGVVVAIVQGFLVKHSVRWWGEKRTIYIGFFSWLFGLLLFAFVNQSWMLFLSVIPYCFGGIATPTLQGVVSNQYDSQQQGELQGALTSLISLTAIMGPVFMTNVFSYFTSTQAPFIFPGAPFFLGAVCVLVAMLVAVSSLNKNNKVVSEE